MLPARMLSRLIFIAFTLSFFCPVTSAQTETPKTIPFMDFLRMFAEQPDYIAEWDFVVIEEKFGINVHEHIRMAKKQGRVWQEFYPLKDVKGASKVAKAYKVMILRQAGRSGLALDPQTKKYAEVPNGFSAVPMDVEGLVAAAEKMSSKVKVQEVGPASVDGHPVTKFRMTIESEPGDIFFYFARDLKGLLIRIDGGDANPGHITVSNISFDVPDDLFQIPEGYQSVSWDAFMRPIKQKVPASQRPRPVPGGGPGGIPEGIPGPPPEDPSVLPRATLVPPIKAPPDAATKVDVEPLLLNDPKPGYTEEARRNQIQGVVRVRLLVGADGAVKQVKVTTGLPDGLDEKAVEAAYQRHYRPAMKNGQPVARWVDAELEFTLDGK